MGVDLLLWGYPNKLIHFIPPLLPADLVVIPVAGMLIYQYFSTWKTFIPAAIVLAGVLGFIIEHFFAIYNMFDLIKWKHSYSFIGFICLYLGVRLLVNVLKVHSEK